MLFVLFLYCFHALCALFVLFSCSLCSFRTVLYCACVKNDGFIGGVTWEYDAALPKPSAQQGKKVLRWKRFDSITGQFSMEEF